MLFRFAYIQDAFVLRYYFAMHLFNFIRLFVRLSV